MSAVIRPVYETEADRDNELRIAKVVAGEWGLELHRLKRFYPIDFAFFSPLDGRLQCWVEVKCRAKHPHDHYRTVILSQHKLSIGVHLARDTHVPFHFVVEFSDGIWFVPLEYHNCHFAVRLCGPLKEPQVEGIEPCACIPARLFQRIGS